MHKSLVIDDNMIANYISYTTAEFGEVISSSQAKAELVNLQMKGCLLYDDCRSCPLFKNHCPI